MLTEIRRLVHELAPEATERIGYHMPAFELNGHTLVYMSAFKNHIGVYGVAASSRSSATASPPTPTRRARCASR